MWGSISFVLIFVFSYFLIKVNLEKSIKISCGISFFVFLGATIYLTYNLLNYQITKIISYNAINDLKSKWNWANTIELLIILFYIFSNWLILIFCSMIVYESGERLWVCLGSFILIGIIMAFEQLTFLIYELKQ